VLPKGSTLYHSPIDQVIDFLCSSIPASARVLEIGPGNVPFPRADVFVDLARPKHIKPDTFVRCDVCTDPLPFPDNFFDFVYCRHVLEDLWNPFRLCEEISRVGHCGHIETPSPIAEMCRGVDGDGTKEPIYRGYHHHRWFIWRRGDELTFVPKYPLIEYMKADEEWLGSALRNGPQYWNSYYPWNGCIKYRHLQNPADYEFRFDGANPSIIELLNKAINESKLATDQTLMQAP
jgi:SAM-dependent methyltransferase